MTVLTHKTNTHLIHGIKIVTNSWVSYQHQAESKQTVPPNLGRPQKLIRVINQNISRRATTDRTYLKTCNFKDWEQSTLFKCMLR